MSAMTKWQYAFDADADSPIRALATVALMESEAAREEEDEARRYEVYTYEDWLRDNDKEEEFRTMHQGDNMEPSA